MGRQKVYTRLRNKNKFTFLFARKKQLVRLLTRDTGPFPQLQPVPTSPLGPGGARKNFFPEFYKLLDSTTTALPVAAAAPRLARPSLPLAEFRISIRYYEADLNRAPFP